MIERIYVGEHLAELCEILKDPEQRKIWDASLCVKTLLYETRSVRLVKPEFIPILFVTVLYRLCRAGSSTREEAEDEGMHYDLIMEEHVMLAMDLCRVDPDGCKSLLEKSTFHDYDYEEISFDAALDKYTSLQPSQHIITVLGVMMLLMAYPIRSPIIKEFTRTMLVRDRNGLLAMVEGFLSSLGKHVISSPGCTHCGSKVFEKDPITGFWGNEGKLKSCGACRLLTCQCLQLSLQPGRADIVSPDCSPQCAKLAWKAGKCHARSEAAFV